jgi:hypothetical protein
VSLCVICKRQEQGSPGPRWAVAPYRKKVIPVHAIKVHYSFTPRPRYRMQRTSVNVKSKAGWAPEPVWTILNSRILKHFISNLYFASRHLIWDGMAWRKNAYKVLVGKGKRLLRRPKSKWDNNGGDVDTGLITHSTGTCGGLL